MEKAPLFDPGECVATPGALEWRRLRFQPRPLTHTSVAVESSRSHPYPGLGQ